MMMATTLTADRHVPNSVRHAFIRTDYVANAVRSGSFLFTNQFPTSMALKQHSSSMTFQLGRTWNSACKWPLANYADDNVRTLRSADDGQCTREFHQTLEGGCMKQGQYAWNLLILKCQLMPLNVTNRHTLQIRCCRSIA